MAGKDIFKYSLKRSENVKTLPTRTSVKLSSKGKAFVSDLLLFQRFVVLANGCNISFDYFKGHNL